MSWRYRTAAANSEFGSLDLTNPLAVADSSQGKRPQVARLLDRERKQFGALKGRNSSVTRFAVSGNSGGAVDRRAIPMTSGLAHPGLNSAAATRLVARPREL